MTDRTLPERVAEIPENGPFGSSHGAPGRHTLVATIRNAKDPLSR